MKFTDLDEILQLKIKKVLRKENFDLSLLTDAIVTLNNNYDVDALYCKGCEVLFENNNVKQISSVS
jgi:hypothetical protein